MGILGPCPLEMGRV